MGCWSVATLPLQIRSGCTASLARAWRGLRSTLKAASGPLSHRSIKPRAEIAPPLLPGVAKPATQACGRRHSMEQTSPRSEMTNDTAMSFDRITAAFLGLACGDALGAPAEFMTQAQLRARWGQLTEMVGGGVWEPGEWTDDTGMALCVAEGILANPVDPIDEIGDRFLAWADTAKDVGGTITAALAGYRGDWS